MLCTDACPCKIANGSELYNRVSTSKLIKPNISPNGSAKFGDCPNITSTTTNVEILAALENLLKCGGWCSKDRETPPFGNYTYRFRNIDDCNTKCKTFFI